MLFVDGMQWSTLLIYPERQTALGWSMHDRAAVARIPDLLTFIIRFTKHVRTTLHFAWHQQSIVWSQSIFISAILLETTHCIPACDLDRAPDLDMTIRIHSATTFGCDHGCVFPLQCVHPFFHAGVKLVPSHSVMFH
jgi:hypothetical protein